MTKMELQSQVNDLEIELRSLIDAAKDTSKEINLEEVRSKKAAIEEKRASLLKQLAEFDRPKTDEARAAIYDAAEWRKLANGEVRSITMNGTGAINQVKQLFQHVADNDSILDKASFYYGKNAQTNIPVLSPLADLNGVAEGTTNATVDTGAELAVTEIAVKCHPIVLPISAEAINAGSVDLEAELPAIFQKAVRKAMHKGMIVGDGNAKEMKGIFTSAAETGANVTAMAGTVVTVQELAKLALVAAAKDEPYTIVMNPAVYAGIMADTTADESVKIYKESIIRDKNIEGVPVVVDGNCPTATTAGAVLVVAAPLGRYAVGVAGELNITPIKVKGDTNTYFQAEPLFSGCQISASDVYALAVAE